MACQGGFVLGKYGSFGLAPSSAYGSIGLGPDSARGTIGVAPNVAATKYIIVKCSISNAGRVRGVPRPNKKIRTLKNCLYKP